MLAFVLHRLAQALLELADAATLFSHPRHPYTRMLLDAIPDLQVSGRPRTPVAGEVANPLDPPLGCAFHPRCPLASQRCTIERPELKIEPQGSLTACHAVEERRIAV
jgi:peptide/nickel transport system ATP-binding protein